MRFIRQGRYPFKWSKRKDAAYRAKCRREREALPLFAEQIAAEQKGADEVRVEREEAWNRHEAMVRKERADAWRRARQLLREHPDGARLTREWNRHRWLPGTPAYLLDFIDTADWRKTGQP